MSEPNLKLDQLLRTVIGQTRPLQLPYRYSCLTATAALPLQRLDCRTLDYGQHNGVIKLLTWQVGGSSSSPVPNWRWMETDRISEANWSIRPSPVGAHA